MPSNFRLGFIRFSVTLVMMAALTSFPSLALSDEDEGDGAVATKVDDNTNPFEDLTEKEILDEAQILESRKDLTRAQLERARLQVASVLLYKGTPDSNKLLQSYRDDPAQTLDKVVLHRTPELLPRYDYQGAARTALQQIEWLDEFRRIRGMYKTDGIDALKSDVKKKGISLFHSSALVSVAHDLTATDRATLIDALEHEGALDRTQSIMYVDLLAVDHRVPEKTTWESLNSFAAQRYMRAAQELPDAQRAKFLAMALKREDTHSAAVMMEAPGDDAVKEELANGDPSAAAAVARDKSEETTRTLAELLRSSQESNAAKHTYTLALMLQHTDASNAALREALTANAIPRELRGDVEGWLGK